MSDWYTNGKNQLLNDLVHDTGVEDLQVRLVYSHLFELGIIDYDIEKEVIWELYGDEDKDLEDE